MTISSVIALIGFADFGMGNGLLNAISEANGRDDRGKAARAVSSAFFMLAGIALFIAVLFAAMYPMIPWKRVFNLESPLAVSEAGPTMIIFFICFLINLPLGIVQRIQMGYQEGTQNNLWLILGNLLGLAGLLLAIEVKAGLIWLVLAMTGGPVIATVFNAIHLFGWKQPWLRPLWSSVSSSESRIIIRMGIWFFILQLSYSLAFASDNLVAAQVLGPVAVSTYSVVQRMFSVASLMVGIVLVPLWPAYGEAIARGDNLWVKRMLIQSMVISLAIVGILSMVFVVFGAQIIRHWVGSEIVPSFSLLIGFGVWTILFALGNVAGTFLNAANALKFQVSAAVLTGIVSVILKIFFAKSIGLPGIVWGTILGYALFSSIPTLYYVPRLLSGKA
ncbi:MAG: MATE family efflux transporter [Deltaproteobacteria bacterium]|nr:MATE family efflux transporter [Deltaproteobacteria bacterium]